MSLQNTDMFGDCMIHCIKFTHIYSFIHLFPQDVFTVSVGNLPPNASVVIKITYVAELAVEGENISFSLPGSVAPWKRSQALDDVIQVPTQMISFKGTDKLMN